MENKWISAHYDVKKNLGFKSINLHKRVMSKIDAWLILVFGILKDILLAY